MLLKQCDFLRSAHHTFLMAAMKQNIVASEWKERQKSRESRSSPQSMSEDLENIYMAALPVRRERLPVGALQRGLACNPEVRRSHAGSHHLRAVVGAARPRRAL